MTSVSIPFIGNEDENYDQPTGVAARVISTSPTGSRVEFGAGEPEVDVRALQAFETEEEMADAVSAKLSDGSTRVHVDAQYRAEVEARMMLSMGEGAHGLNRTPVFKGREGSEQRRNQMSSLVMDVPQPQDVFDSMDEVVVAMSDPRYASDSKYRSAIDLKIGRSKF